MHFTCFYEVQHVSHVRSLGMHIIGFKNGCGDLTFVLVVKAEVFYNVNYVNVNYSVKNSTADCKYLLYLQFFL